MSVRSRLQEATFVEDKPIKKRRIMESPAIVDNLNANQVESRSVMIQIMVTPSMAERLDRVADYERRTRTQQAARLVEDGVVQIEKSLH